MPRADFRPIPFRLSLSAVAALAEAQSCLEVPRSGPRGPRSRFQLGFRLTAVLGKSPPGAMPAVNLSQAPARVSA
jgi:hypothetical protein